MAVKDRETIKSEAATFINDNVVEDISAQDVRDRIIDLADSARFLSDPGGGSPGSPGTITGGLTIEDFGAVAFDPSIVQAEAAFDSGPAVQAAMVFANQKLVVIGCKGHHYRMNTPVNLISNQHNTLMSAGRRLPWGLDLKGAQIVNTKSSSVPLFAIGANNILSMLVLRNFAIRGGSGTQIYMYSRIGVPNVNGSFLQFSLDRLNIAGGTRGIHLHGECFESHITKCEVRDCQFEGIITEGGNTNLAGGFAGSGSGVLSSVYITNCNLSQNGSHGYRAAGTGSAASVQQTDFVGNHGAGIRFENGNPGNMIRDSHFENNWTGSAPSTGLGHCQITNTAYIVGCNFTTSFAGARTALNMFAANHAIMAHCTGTSILTLAQADASAGKRLRVIACDFPGGAGGGNMARDVWP